MQTRQVALDNLFYARDVFHIPWSSYFASCHPFEVSRVRLLKPCRVCAEADSYKNTFLVSATHSRRSQAGRSTWCDAWSATSLRGLTSSFGRRTPPRFDTFVSNFRSRHQGESPQMYSRFFRGGPCVGAQPSSCVNGDVKRDDTMVTPKGEVLVKVVHDQPKNNVLWQRPASVVRKMCLNRV